MVRFGRCSLQLLGVLDVWCILCLLLDVGCMCLLLDVECMCLLLDVGYMYLQQPVLLLAISILAALGCVGQNRF